MTIRKPKKFIIVLTLLLLPAIYFWYTQERDNFHPITHGEAYRSAQLSRDELEYYIEQYNIKSVLNLRGENPGSSWYKEEKVTCAKHNVIHFDIPLSAYREPDIAEVKKLVEVFKIASRPILIHCQAGADRSGLAAAMWKVIVDGVPKSEAAKQLSLLYGHIPIGKTSALDHFFQNWDPRADEGYYRVNVTPFSGSINPRPQVVPPRCL